MSEKGKSYLLSENARRILRVSGNLAMQSGNKYIWLVHILYSIVTAADPAARAMKEHGITAELVHRHLPERHHDRVKRISFHPRVIAMVPSIMWAMNLLENVQVWPGHFVLAMIRDRHKLLVDLCQEVGISLQELQDAIIESMNDSLEYSLQWLLRGSSDSDK